MTSPPSEPAADVVVVGAGAAGLSLAWRLAAGPGAVPSVTLIEPPPGPARSPDRTWCFWEEEGGDFDDLLTASWSRMRVTARDGRTVTGEMPLPYKMLRSSRFTGELDARLEGAPGVRRRTGTVTEIVDTPGGARVGGRDAAGRPFALDARQVYDTRPPRRLPRARTTLLQHFRGWFVRTEQDRFDPDVAELMDLRVPQPPRGVAFVYVLPFDARTALIEYTQFTMAPLDGDGYEAALRHYTEVVRPLGAFTVTGAEQGLIPMTDGVFPRRTGRAVFPLGVAGGAVRPATGYAFAAIQRQTSALAAAHRAGRMSLPPRPHAHRHLAMDAVMLRALAAGHVEGARFFEVLFARNPLPRVVGFLSGRTSLAEDLALGARCPVPPMVRSLAELPFLPRLPGPDMPRVAVVGGGIAGLAAATVLAERGARVEVLERHHALGGRLAGERTLLADGTTVTMSRGFHAFFRQYYNLRALLRRTDAGLSRLVPLPDYPLQHSDGARDGFRRVPRTPPWSVLGFAALSPSFTLRGMAGMNPRSALPLFDVRVPEIYDRLDRLSAADFLQAVRFPPQARYLAFEVFSRSFFADPRELSAAELVLMFHIYFLGSAEGLLFDVPGEPFPDALWDPLAAYLAGHDVRLRTGAEVREVRPAGEGFDLVTATSGARTEHYDAVVLALDGRGLRTLTAASPLLGDEDWRSRVTRLREAPPFLVSRWWLKGAAAPSRPGFLGTSGYGPLDNVSVLERWEDEAAAWAARTGGSVVETHAYAVAPDADRAAVEREVHDQLVRLYPELTGVDVVDVRHVWHDDCPLFPVGGYADRPAVTTPHARLALAGDGVRTSLPVALMERAATTGFQAANVLLATWGVRGEPLWSVPIRGRSSALRFLARYAR